MPVAVARTPLAEDQAAGETALLVVDMLSSWDFPGGDTLLQQAEAIAPHIAALKQRCRRAGVPVVYVNDNQGRWRSDYRAVLGAAQASGGGGARLAGLLAPAADDYFVLKVKHSAFHATPLDLLLRHLGARKLLITGVSSEQCVLYSAADARMLDYDVVVPADCVASQTAGGKADALRHIERVLACRTAASTEIELPLPDSGKGGGRDGAARN